MKLNLGAGPKRRHKEGYVNVDILPDADAVVDLGKESWPWVSDSVDRIEADNLAEHFDNDEFLHFMNEAHRVLKPGGKFWVRVPDALNWFEGAFADPTHKRFFCWPRSFDYLNVTRPQWRNYGRFYGFKGWKVSGDTDGKFIVAELIPDK